YNLSPLSVADLSKNRFMEIPPEVCLFAPLESLNLYHNCIKCIPEAIINLQMLTYLNISRNQLSTLPKYLFDLPLKVLVVSNNKLVSIPEEIGKAKDLMELDISCNEIQVLPPQMGKLQSLRELNIRRNCLQVLPAELADLPLIRLDFSCNKITEIPVCYRKLRHVQLIILDNNPMQSPPAQICLKGKVHIFKYLNIKACRQMDKKPDSLDLPSLGKRILQQPLTDSMEDFYPSKSHGPDSGIGSDNGDKRLSTTEPSDDDTISLHSQVSETHRELVKTDNQEPYDYIDPNAEEDTPLSEASDVHFSGQYVSCIKELERVLGKSNQLEEKDSWKEESGSDKEQQHAEEEDELKEVIDLRKIAVQLLQQEQQNRRRSLICRATFSESLIHRRRPTGRAHRFLSHSGSSPNSRQKSPARSIRRYFLNHFFGIPEGLLLVRKCLSVVLQPSGSDDGNPKQDQTDSVQKWPDAHPLVYHSEDRRRNKYLRKDYIKYKCQSSSRKSSSGNENDHEGGIHSSDCNTTLTVFGLKPRSAFSRSSRQDYGAVDPGFTMRRKMEHLREEMEQIRQLRDNLESRLKVLLPDDVGAALMDGVVLCHLANHIRPRSVASIHVPSPAVPKLSMAKCRRNVENFLEACKKLGVPQDKLCLPHHILEERGLVKVGITVQALLDLPASRPTQLSAV
ncbi:LRCH2 protein, partial [Atractosteus spatula]|nr:LRCH2 protein [Atractosteus spatula]